ncbi:hypothetical protein WR25_11498 isoform E [Diploscapter pachys]|uniref:POU-specific atypical domain-containing protein n=2 Tax=Diploscapter pachys TaxID=2018661 RepID=A0A2A2L791_9BILA|nr:hypothetical protein WR25_11498 isoform B [Diploscapter pachys]PAV82033.1 hypothetical protein WR25_11498 isoform E [Diploscapter pachys]
MQSAQKKAKKRPASNSHQTPVASKMRLSDDRPSVIDIESPPPAMASSLINEDTSHLNVGDITPRTDAARRFVAATTYLRSIPVDKIKGQQYKQFSDFEFEGLHIPEKLVELVKACNDKLRIEISDYFYTNNLKQGDIANLTGLSPSSISRVLNPNTKESVTMINIFIVFACYLDCISYPDLLEAYNSIKDGKQSSHRAHKSHKKFKTVDEVRNRLDNAAKKFEKHPILLAPLNTYFKETPTPDWSRAEEIAKSCNNILDDLANRGLSSSSYEAITPLDIYRLFEKTNQIRKEQFALDPEGKIHEFDDNYIQLVIKHYVILRYFI